MKKKWKDGWKKKSRHLKRYRKRYAVLNGLRFMMTFKTKENLENATEIIDLLQLKKIEVIDNENKQYRFDIIVDNVIFSFASFSLKEREAWIAKLNSSLSIFQTCVITQDTNGDIMYGCKHCKQNCCFKAKCCNKWYMCTYCHNEMQDNIKNGHTLDRKSIISMHCMKCGKEQKPSQYCSFCKNEETNQPYCMARYFCEKCCFWDNNKNSTIFHCDGCKLCRFGNKEDFVHCDACGVCLNKVYYKVHKCNEQSTQCECPICNDFLHTSDKAVTFWPFCGHAIHVECMKDYLKFDNQCSICRSPYIL